jgi:hypothetical protein
VLFIFLLAVGLITASMENHEESAHSLKQQSAAAKNDSKKTPQNHQKTEAASETLSNGESQKEVMEELESNNVPLVDVLVSSAYDPIRVLFERIQTTLLDGHAKHSFYMPFYIMIMNYLNKIHHVVVAEKLTMNQALQTALFSILDLKKGDAPPQYAQVCVATAIFYDLEVNDSSLQPLTDQVNRILSGNYQKFTARLVHKEASNNCSLMDGAYVAVKKMYSAFANAQNLRAIFDQTFLHQYSQWAINHSDPIPIEGQTGEHAILNGSFGIKTGRYEAHGRLSFSCNAQTAQKTHFVVEKAVHTLTDFVFTVILPRNTKNMLMLKDKARLRGFCINYRETESHFILQFSLMQTLAMTFMEKVSSKEGFFVDVGEEALPAGVRDTFHKVYTFTETSTPEEQITPSKINADERAVPRGAVVEAVSDSSTTQM